MMFVHKIFTGTSVLLLLGGVLSQPAQPEDYSRNLESALSKAKGDLKRAEEFFELKSRNPVHDDGAFAALGFVRFLKAVQGLAHARYRFNPDINFAQMLLIARFPVHDNPNPERATYEALMQVVDDARSQIALAESSLQSVDTQGKFSFTLNLAVARLDLNMDRVADADENLWNLVSVINRQEPIEAGLPLEALKRFNYRFDGADIHLLRAYCHLMMAICDLLLAYDERELFNRCGHVVFPNFATQYPKSVGTSKANQLNSLSVLDLAATVHLFRFPLKSKERVLRAHGHLLATVDQWRECITLINAEKDNDREWFPGVQQVPAHLKAEHEAKMNTWKDSLVELEDVLMAKKLLPFWRRTDLGINVRKFFTEPSDFDLMLILQGSDLEQRFEQGPLCNTKVLSGWIPELLRIYSPFLNH